MSVGRRPRSANLHDPAGVRRRVRGKRNREAGAAVFAGHERPHGALNRTYEVYEWVHEFARRGDRWRDFAHDGAILEVQDERLIARSAHHQITKLTVNRYLPVGDGPRRPRRLDAGEDVVL